MIIKIRAIAVEWFFHVMYEADVLEGFRPKRGSSGLRLVWWPEVFITLMLVSWDGWLWTSSLIELEDWAFLCVCRLPTVHHPSLWTSRERHASSMHGWTRNSEMHGRVYSSVQCAIQKRQTLWWVLITHTLTNLPSETESRTCSLFLVQDRNHTTFPLISSRSWLSYTRTVRWRRRSRSMRIFCNIRQVRDFTVKHAAEITSVSDVWCLSGVYKHVTGSELGGHAVKILGWGTENGSPYWLVANSWNSDWGDKGKNEHRTPHQSHSHWSSCLCFLGYFKILRGQNECGIESEMVAGIPQLWGRSQMNVSPVTDRYLIIQTSNIYTRVFWA